MRPPALRERARTHRLAIALPQLHALPIRQFPAPLDEPPAQVGIGSDRSPLSPAPSNQSPLPLPPPSSRGAAPRPQKSPPRLPPQSAARKYTKSLGSHGSDHGNSLIPQKNCQYGFCTGCATTVSSPRLCSCLSRSNPPATARVSRAGPPGCSARQRPPRNSSTAASPPVDTTAVVDRVTRAAWALRTTAGDRDGFANA